jgi:hypothetical protein
MDHMKIAKQVSAAVIVTDAIETETNAINIAFNSNLSSLFLVFLITAMKSIARIMLTVTMDIAIAGT